MQIVVFGASGKVGRRVVDAALERGHNVVAFVHSNSPFEPHARLAILKGDIHDAEAVSKAVAGSDAVISALGSWHTPTKDIVASAMRNIIPAMESNSIDRIITLTGAGAYAPNDRPSLLYRLGHAAFGVFARKIIFDGEEHIRLLEASALRWTTLRSPVMSNGHLSAYSLSMRGPALWATIPRKAVVKAILDQLEGPAYERQAPFIRSA